jgi:photosystem II stability/assembly factor-like uncharacterized protein
MSLVARSHPVMLAILVASPLQAQWVPQSSGTNAEFRGLSVVSTSVVWASGTRGRIARTTDGGTTWVIDTVPGAATLDFRDIAAPSAKRAWALSAGEASTGAAKIFATADGGARWALQFSTDLNGVFLDALGFWDERHGIAMSDPVEGRLFLLTTDDGGATWNRVSPERSPAVLPGEAAFAASGTCLAVQGKNNVWIATGGAERARVFRSTDRGRSWSVAETPVHSGGGSAGIFSVAFADAEHGAVVGGDYQKPTEPFDNVALTDDGGRSWRRPSGPLPQGYMSGVTYLPGTRGRSLVAVGLAGTARSIDGGDSWSMLDSVAYNSVSFISPAVGWAVGPRGRIAKWDEGAVGGGPAKP